MEQTTLQQRIEERAKQKLLQHLLTAANKEKDIVELLGRENYTRQLDVRSSYYDYIRQTDIDLCNDYSNALFEKMLPNFIEQVTDEILKKIDEIDYLVKENQTPAEY